MLYGLIIFIRNKAYDFGILTSTKFKIPVITIGNLTTGGTGKTPHVEYLLNLLRSTCKLATLSRGYGRSTSGFLEVTETSTSLQVGDEPAQLKRKFKDVVVAVEENRVHGIIKIQNLFPQVNVVLMDDAFQHRAIQPGLSILLTEYNKPFYSDFMLPTGNLREFKWGYKRADIIVVTKTPELLPSIEKSSIIKKIDPEPHQQVYFSHIRYGELVPLNEVQHSSTSHPALHSSHTIILLTGIANSTSLENYLKEKVKNIIPVKFNDHHEYSITELIKVRKVFQDLASANKIIITTEKDAMRLVKPELLEVLKGIPVFYIPIEIAFHDENKAAFEKQILNFINI